MSRSLSSVLIVIGSLFAVFFVTWLYLRGRVESKPIKAPFEHPFLALAHPEKKPFLMLRLAAPQDAIALAAKADKSMSVGAWLDVRLGGEGQLVISVSELLKSGTAAGKPVEIATRAECREAGLFELLDFAEALRNLPSVFNLISRRPGLSNKVLEIWAPEKNFSISSVAIQSESDGTLKELREAQPRGFYGSSQATLIQMEVLANLNLEGLMDLKSDLLISSTEELRRDGTYTPRVRDATLKEAHRRGLKRYAGPARNAEIAKELLSLGYDGLIIENRSVLDSLTH